MTEPQFRFEDGAAYEQMMGKWSRLVGDVFIDWLNPGPGLRWLDVGCGNGAFTELLVERCAPVAAEGIDPSEGQLAFARSRPAARLAKFQIGNAQALPFDDASFDAAVMALVIFFVPDPVQGVAEMARVVRPGGSVSAYAWDITDGGFPFEPIYAEIRAAGLKPMLPPSVEASRVEALRDLWSGAGLANVEGRQITVQRTFASFDDFWATAASGSAIRPILATLTDVDVEALKARVCARLPAAADGSVTFASRANAIKGRVRG